MAEHCKREIAIPKIIHFCWFGGNPYSPLIKKCMASWERYLPDYELIRWDESNFDINSNRYVQEAYQAKKWAFVSDYVRLYALYHFGGVYMDTDVEVYKSLDRFLVHPAFSGFETEEQIPTGIMGAVKQHSWIANLLSYYEDKSFLLPNGQYDQTTNVVIISNMSDKYGLVRDGSYQIFADGVHMYPREFFCPIAHGSDKRGDGEFHLTQNTYTIHHYAGSWLSAKDRFVLGIKHRLRGLLGDSVYKFIKSTFLRLRDIRKT